MVIIPSGTKRRKCVPKLENANKLNLVDKGTFPFFRSEDIEEERSFHKVPGYHPKLIMSTRRLLYVACTRAQSLLYILYSRQRQVAGKTKSAYLSDFVAAVFEKDHVCVIISFSGLESFDSSSRVSSVLTSLDIRPRIELSYRKSCIDQFRMKKKLNADFLNCKPARFLWVQFHNQNRRKSAGDKVKPVYRQANGEFYTVSLTGEKSVQDSPRK